MAAVFGYGQRRDERTKVNDKVGQVQRCVREGKGLRAPNCRTLHRELNQMTVTTYSYGDWERSGILPAATTSL